MEGQRQRAGGRRKRRKPRTEQQAPVEPVFIAARRPQLNGGSALRSADPGQATQGDAALAPTEAAEPSTVQARPPARREARIIGLPTAPTDDQERQRLRLLERLRVTEGRGAISRVANEYRQGGYVFPEEQEIQLQLLEHFDETCVREAITSLTRMLARQSPIKRPVLDQRLRRLEENADDADTRSAAAALRRSLR